MSEYTVHEQRTCPTDLLREERDRLRAALVRIEAGDFALRDDEHDERLESAKRPTCDECNEPMHPFTDPNSGEDGWGCDLCGWSEP